MNILQQKRRNKKSTESKTSKNHLPQQKYTPPPSLHNTVSNSPSMFDSLKQGISFGIGSSIGHNIVHSIFNTNDKKEELNKKEISNKIEIDKEAHQVNTKIYELYNKCLEEKKNSIECSSILEKK
jgi:hypothetical protein